MLCSLQMVDLGNGTVYIEWAMGCQEPGCNGNLLPDGERSPGGMFLVSATRSVAVLLLGLFVGSFDGGGCDRLLHFELRSPATLCQPQSLWHSILSRYGPSYLE